MCGIFGFVAKGDNKLDLPIIKAIATITMSRGPHAWGMAWVDGRGKLRTYKQTGAIVDSLGLLAMAKDARLLIGHCRWATHGDPADNTNNHPHDGGDSYVVHNGVIHHYRSLVTKHRLRMHTECDSEVLGLMLQKFRGKPLSRAARTAREAMGVFPFAMMALWPDRLIATRANGQPLHVGETRDAYYLASLKFRLPGYVSEFPEGEILEYA
jgi:glucosamine--fructose-6-phosphate aminotransferase (isomerizing)